MNVLSLFDGISCGQLALKRANIKYDNYFASEIDKYAIEITQKNFPDTIQLGDVTKVKCEDLPEIDLLMGGSPCTGFSTCGKGLNFNDPQSKLFFDYVRLLEECKPKWFLLENVSMKKEWEDIISSYVKVNPIMINSNLFSAQNRKRLYWTNIPINKLPLYNDKVIKDIIFDDNYNIIEFTETMKNTKKITKTNTVVWKVNSNKKRYSMGHSAKFKNEKCSTLITKCDRIKIVVDYDKNIFRKLHPIEAERLQTLPDNYTEGISKNQRYKTIGNGWTVDVIAHILKGIKNENHRKNK